MKQLYYLILEKTNGSVHSDVKGEHDSLPRIGETLIYEGTEYTVKDVKRELQLAHEVLLGIEEKGLPKVIAKQKRKIFNWGSH